ncbi:hypothetical protein EES43_17725 [Streptomyces sp. ADI96-02]|nr:hypothetical protein EES43_17725 [Streptomyces sp. ADI96-02]
MLVLAPGPTAGDDQEVDQGLPSGQAIEECREVRLQVHRQAQGVDRHGARLVLGPLAGQDQLVQSAFQRQAGPVVADDFLGNGGDLVGAPGALDEVPVGHVLGTRGPALCPNGCGGVQVGGGELRSEHPGELDRRVVIVERLDADAVNEVVGLAVPIEAVHDQFGLDDRGHSVRVRDARPVGGVLDQVTDLEAGVPVVGSQIFAGGALAALRHSAEGDDVHVCQRSAGNGGVQGRQVPADLVLDGDGRSVTDADQHVEAAVRDESVDLRVEMALVGRVNVRDGGLVGQAAAGTFLGVLTVQEQEGAFVSFGCPEIGLVRRQEGSSTVGGPPGIQVLPYGDGGRDGCLQHRDPAVQKPYGRGVRMPGALQVGMGEHIGDLLGRPRLEPPAAHAVGLDGRPAPVVVVKGTCRGGGRAHTAGEDSDLFGLAGVVGTAERDRHGEGLRITAELADHRLPFAGWCRAGRAWRDHGGPIRPCRSGPGRRR